MPISARMYMYLKGTDNNQPITGEVVDAEFAQQIDIDGWDWEMSYEKNQSKLEVREKPEPGLFTFTKIMDRSSLQMLNRLKSGEKLSAILTLVENSDYAFQLIIRLRNVRIIEYKVDGKDGEKSAELKENWTFNYDEITFENTLAVARHQTKTMTTVLKRSAQASTDKQDEGQRIVEDFNKLSPNDKPNVAKRLQETNKDLWNR